MHHPLAVALLLVVGSLVLCSAGNPENDYDVLEMIQARGYPVEQHYATTPDGFILSIQRITGPRYSHGSKSLKPVALLQHGFLDSSITWVLQEVVNESLGFILADAGYDVWLPNVRGNTYSTNNTHLSPSQNEFWEWSFDEMAKYDLPTIIHYILATSRASKLSYIGHSQGSLMGFVGFSDLALSSKVNVFVALGPVAWVYNSKSPLFNVLAALKLNSILELLGPKNFLPDTALMRRLFPALCSVTPSLCENFMGLIMGFDNEDLNATRLPVMTAHMPAGTSIYNLLHWVQMKQQDAFQDYDYGTAGNMEHYNSTTPPQYHPENLNPKLPVAIFYGGEDDLSDVKDVERLMTMLPNVVYGHLEPEYAHADFVWGENAKDIIYAPVLALLNKYKTL